MLHEKIELYSDEVRSRVTNTLAAAPIVIPWASRPMYLVTLLGTSYISCLSNDGPACYPTLCARFMNDMGLPAFPQTWGCWVLARCPPHMRFLVPVHLYP